MAGCVKIKGSTVHKMKWFYNKIGLIIIHIIKFCKREGPLCIEYPKEGPLERLNHKGQVSGKNLVSRNTYSH